MTLDIHQVHDDLQTIAHHLHDFAESLVDLSNELDAIRESLQADPE